MRADSRQGRPSSAIERRIAASSSSPAASSWRQRDSKWIDVDSPSTHNSGGRVTDTMLSDLPAAAISARVQTIPAPTDRNGIATP